MKSDNLRIRGLMFIFGLVSSGCFPAVTTPPLSPSDAPSARAAYIYGFFGMDRKTYLEHHFGIVLACSNGKEHTLWFAHENPLLMFEIAPATCSLKYALVHDEITGNNFRFSMPRDALHNVEFQAGKAYYLGNLVARLEHEAKDKFMAAVPNFSNRVVWRIETTHKYEWKIVDSSNAYETDTRIMRQKFTNFKSIETEKRLLDSAQLPPEEQKQERARIQKDDAKRDACGSELATCRSRCGPPALDAACLRACRKSYEACIKASGDF